MDYSILNKTPDVAQAVVNHFVDANGNAVPQSAAAPQPVQGSVTLISVTPTIDTGIYAAGDLLFDVTAIAAAVLAQGDGCLVDSLTVIDKDGQAAPIDVYVSQGNASMGTINAAPSISAASFAANLPRLLCQVLAGDYTTVKAGLKQATKPGLALEVKAGAATTGIYLSAVVQGTPTYTNAANLVLLVGIVRQ